MKKHIKIFFTVFMILVLNAWCFSEQHQKSRRLNRLEAIDFITKVSLVFPTIPTTIPPKCSNCKNYLSEYAFYHAPFESENVIYFYGLCKKCNYLEVGYNGDKTNEIYYKGTK